VLKPAKHHDHLAYSGAKVRVFDVEITPEDTTLGRSQLSQPGRGRRHFLAILLTLCLVRPDLRRLIALRGDAHVEAVTPGVEVAGPNADPRRKIGNQVIVIGVSLLKYAVTRRRGLPYRGIVRSVIFAKLRTTKISAIPSQVRIARSENEQPFQRGFPCDFIA
jgi:hypothetical protein